MKFAAVYFIGVSLFMSIPPEGEGARLKLRRTKSRSYKKSVWFNDCGSIYDILELSITGCVQTPCKLQLGALVAVNAEFNDYGEDVHVLKHDAYWVLNAVNTKASVTPQACDGKSCPFRGDEGLAFTANLYINMTLPALRGTLFWEVYNESEERVMCYKVPISLMVP
ncbi:uncharacterized protein LOC119652984 isoform X2 [Hermetia illucens]|uniref:uncharacterized protein LOC119652984 isoform X2 n=1 Tax=Hermetia illucens TaxID=343691 RepID=UPI0018CC38E9|nr:uncharacterized protein LOC119652984 isoform X2 [Hermetia illucens]